MTLKEKIYIGIIIVLSLILLFVYKNRNVEIQETPKVDVPLILSNSDYAKNLALENESLKEKLKKSDVVKTLIQTKEIIRYDTLKIPFTKTVYKRDTIKTKDTIQITNTIEQIDFNYKDSLLSISGRVTPNNLVIDSLLIKNEISIAVIKRKKWFLGKRRYEVIVTSNNPNIKLYGTTSVIVNDPNTKIKDILTGILVGGGIMLIAK